MFEIIEKIVGIFTILFLSIIVLAIMLSTTGCKQVSYPDYNTTCETDIWGNTDCIIVNFESEVM